MGSKRPCPTGFREQHGPGQAPGVTCDGTSQLIRAQPPVSTGRFGLFGNHASGGGPLQRAYSQTHLDIKNEAARHPGQKVDPFTVAETFRHYVVEGHAIDTVLKSHQSQNNEYIHKYKSYYVHAMRDTIKSAAAKFGLPAVLLAGTVYNEVGGADLVKPYWHGLWETLGASEKADKISLGPTSIQPRNALASLGYDPAKVEPSIKKEVVESLIHDNAFAIYVTAKHLGDLRSRYFPEKGAVDLDTQDVQVLGARYNRGTAETPDQIKGHLSYGKRITERQDKLVKLLSEMPVSEPDWKSR